MTDSGDLSVNTSCALEGGDCLAALIDDTTAIYVEDTTPSDETDYQTRFLFDPNDLSMGGGEELDIFQALDDTVVAFQVQLKKNGANYEIRLQVNDDNPSPQTTAWEPINNGVNDIVVEWWASSSVGANDGVARLWIDGELIETLTGIDNDLHQVDKARLGAVAGIDAGTSGTMYFDNYASWTEAEGIVYDGQGTRVKTTIDDVTTVYVSGIYENDVTNSEERTYYANSAMRVDDGTNDDVYWILEDHLGSVSTIIDTDGQSYSQYGERRYKAWGEERYNSGSIPTTRGYTGQREEADIGLYFYNARWYDPNLGRFIQADTILPNPYDNQSYDRYAYTFNNPLKYSDGSGHFPWLLVIAVVVVVTKIVDYAITAKDIVDSGEVLADPNSSGAEKLMAGLNIALAIIFEALEPDELLPVGLPLDDVARRALMSGAKEAFEEGGEEALERFLKDNLGEYADEVIDALRRGSIPDINDANKMKHIFKPKHGLDFLVTKYGSQKGAYFAAYTKYSQYVKANNLTAEQLKQGITLILDGKEVFMRGNIVDGVIRLSDFWVPKP